MKNLNSALSILMLMATSSSLAFVRPSHPDIQAPQASLVENIVYKGSATKPSDLTTKATYRLELSVVGLSDIKLPSCTATLISKDILLTAATV